MDLSCAPTLSVPQFQERWRDRARQERPFAHLHFLDLCRLVGFPDPVEAARDAIYGFEQRVKKTDGGEGFVDVWYRGRFAWEYKGRGGNLDKAYDQLLRYREALWNPKALIVTDMDRILVHTNFSGTAKKTYELNLETIARSDKLDLLRAAFHDPDALDPGQPVQTVTEEAASQFATLATVIEARGVPPHQTAHLLVQVLFCLFAEDAGLLRRGLFGDLLRSAQTRPEGFPARLEELFTRMRDGGNFGVDSVDWFNGGLFAQIAVIPFTAGEIGQLSEAAKLDWSKVEPAIFGTLFERSLDPRKRKQFGMVYTPRADVERVVERVMMTPLRRRWDEVRVDADRLKALWDETRTPTHRRSARARKPDLARAAFANRLFALKQELKAVRVLDPACGSGNFLYVALAALHGLEKEVSLYGAMNDLPFSFPDVRPTQLHGLEVNPFARELAQVVVWIGHLQWMRDNGFHSDRNPVLDPLETIRLQDALVYRDGSGRASEAPWPEADYIIGNPPFLGGKRLRSAMGDDEVDDLFRVYGGRVRREADLVCYFFEKARAEIEGGRAKRAGLLATNSIRGGANRDVLSRIKQSGDIFEAWPDEPWALNGTAVRVSIIGFDDGQEKNRSLDGAPVAAINADLTASIDVTVAKRLPENVGVAFMGDTKGGPFEVSGDLARRWLALPCNPNGRPNGDVVRPWVNGLDVTRRPRGMWIVDFGVSMAEDDAALYEAPFEYVRAHVKPAREKSRTTISQWWLHERPRVDMRVALEGLPRFICTPTVAKHRLFVWSDGKALADHQIIAVARDDDYSFGVLQSRAHEVWSLQLGSSLEDRPRYTPTNCFETFPFPEPSMEQRAAIAATASALDGWRRAWLDAADDNPAEQKRRTLTNLYNARPTWLDDAHGALDRAVWAAYGWEDCRPSTVAADDILARLLKLNLERAENVIAQADAGFDDRLLDEGPSVENDGAPPALVALAGFRDRAEVNAAELVSFECDRASSE